MERRDAGRDSVSDNSFSYLIYAVVYSKSGQNLLLSLENWTLRLPHAAI